jgi:hypothetical protein
MIVLIRVYMLLKYKGWLATLCFDKTSQISFLMSGKGARIGQWCADLAK